MGQIIKKDTMIIVKTVMFFWQEQQHLQTDTTNGRVHFIVQNTLSKDLHYNLYGLKKMMVESFP